jgi:hypothetical protein
MQRNALRFGLLPAVAMAAGACTILRPPDGSDRENRASLITAVIQREYWDAEPRAYLDVIPRRRQGLPYAMMWGNGMQFLVLASAAGHAPEHDAHPMKAFLDGLEAYWNPRLGLYSAYLGGTDDVYYDDNQWMVLAYVEAFEVTGDRAYLDKARAVLEGCLAGVDDVLGGGSYWHVDRERYPTKNTCSNAPLAVALLRVRHHLADPPTRARYLTLARDILTWTRDTLQDPAAGVMLDHINTESREIVGWTFTYNTALMIEGWLHLHQATGAPEHLSEALRLGRVCTHWLRSHGPEPSDTYFADPVFFVVHLVEALRMLVHSGHLPADECGEVLRRLAHTADAYWYGWRQGGDTPLLEIAAIARLQWLTADLPGVRGPLTSPGDDRVWSVRIELPGENRTLQLAEVEVLRNGVNVARSGHARQSTIFEQAFASLAIDGNPDGDYQSGTVSHTAEGQNSPWWEVALETPGAVESVRVWNRTDACSERIRGARVLFLNGQREVLWSTGFGDELAAAGPAWKTDTP